ncbi:hypothetical protein AOQ73_26735 [Bradyrhizobium pachyrhizi]|uniref:hypothetical protein n=1 Tax=Bradyrhizobium pachyrhizi TaxID=280333 RepID=UPI000704BE89|nr:hypothetical protein [Bradyrhizobium pachyrhizi]KRP89221.1 hypothetical protein AOQ73_26735 [Bradyrhizobium pachyrhizi]
MQSLRDASASFGATPPSNAAIGAAKAMEDTMQLWTISELMHLTRDELCDLASRIEGTLCGFEPGTVGRLNALTSLDNIRRVMVRRDLHF